jgi:predicted Zn-dependent protease
MSETNKSYDEAIALQQNGDIEGAIAKLLELIAQQPDYALAHAALSVFYSRTDRHDQAIECAEKVCSLEPEDPFSFVAMSLIYQKAGRIADAERAMMQSRQAQMAALQHRAAE